MRDLQHWYKYETESASANGLHGTMEEYDFTFIVPENTDVSTEDEMRNVLLWSDDNKLSVNLSKCKEIVFRSW